MSYYLVLIPLGLAVVFGFLCMAGELRRLRSDVDRLEEKRRELRDEFRDHKWDMQAALAAAGLKKTNAKQAEWVKD